MESLQIQDRLAYDERRGPGALPPPALILNKEKATHGAPLFISLLSALRSSYDEAKSGEVGLRLHDIELVAELDVSDALMSVVDANTLAAARHDDHVCSFIAVRGVADVAVPAEQGAVERVAVLVARDGVVESQQFLDALHSRSPGFFANQQSIKSIAFFQLSAILLSRLGRFFSEAQSPKLDEGRQC